SSDVCSSDVQDRGKYKIGTDRFTDFRSVPMFFWTGGNDSAKGERKRDCSGIFPKGGGDHGTECADLFPGDPGGGDGSGPSRPWKRGFCVGSFALFVLQAYGSEIFRRNHGRPVRILSLSL